MLLVTSASRECCWNLAAEDCLLERAPADGPILFLWQARDTVVIGKNQNPWRECPVGWLPAEDIRFARRISGGGAVYHDAGNLNYAFFCERVRYRADDVYAALIGGLRGLGVPAARLGRTSLGVGGRKFSGNAFCHRRGGVMHHGTLLVATDLGRLRRSLEPPPLEIDARAVPSEPAEVVNLSALDPAWDANRVGRALTAGFEEVYGPVKCRHTPDDLDPDRMRRRFRQFQSDEWRLGKTPPFRVRLRTGGADVALVVTQGRVSNTLVARSGGLAWTSCLGSWFRAADLAAVLAPDPDSAAGLAHAFNRLGL